MKKTEIEQNFDYAHYTFMTGTQTFHGVDMILSNMIDNFKDVTSHPCGTFSYTNDMIARNAISDTAIIMSHSLLEGFFHEEYEFYLKNKNTKKPKQLSGLINTLLHAHNINIRDQKKRMNVINMITLLRNSVVHSNGTLNTDFNKEKCEKILGEDLFKHSDSYPRLTLTKSLWLLREYQSIAHEYSKAVFDKATEHEASCLGQSDMN